MRLAICAAAAACIASPSLGQSTTATLPTPEELSNRDILTVGLGGGVVPTYEGSNDYRIIPVGAVRGRYHGISFNTQGAYLYVDVLPSTKKFSFDAGPIVGAKFGRNHSKDDIVKLLPKLNTAIEAGGFVGVTFRGVTNPYDSLSLRMDVLHDFANAHQSTTFSPNLGFSSPLSRSTFVSANIGAEFVSNRFADYYFGITPADSADTGGVLPVYNPSGGMKNWKAALLLNQSLTGNLLHGFSIFGVGQYSRLVGDFKRAPIVSDRGSANQWVGALGLAYTW